MDAADLTTWAGCKTGPNVPLEAAAPDFDDCVAADLDADNDVDLGDFSLMQPALISGFAPPAATSYTYNYRNELVAVDLPTGERHEYRYDVLGRRVGKIVDVGGPAEHAVVYFYDGSRVIEERGETGPEATYVFGLYVDEILSMRRAIGGAPTDFYFFTDDQYSVTAVTAPDGDVLERYTYDDFGALTILDPAGQPRTASAIGNPYTYTGRRYDVEIGLYYYRTRHLDPATGRFTSRDSIGLWGDPLNLGNAYTYVGNNPWTFVDPYGLQNARVRRPGRRTGWEQFEQIVPLPREEVERRRLTTMMRDAQATADRARATLKGIDIAEDYGSSLIPIVNDGRDLIGFKYGYDPVTGERLDGWGQGLCGVGLVVGNGRLFRRAGDVVGAGAAMVKSKCKSLGSRIKGKVKSWFGGGGSVADDIGDLPATGWGRGPVGGTDLGREYGSYTNLHQSGKRYHGQGNRSRSQVSGRQKATEYDDPHIATDWTSAPNRREAMKDEARRLAEDGGVEDPNNYNRINSPGKKYLGEDGD